MTAAIFFFSYIAVESDNACLGLRKEKRRRRGGVVSVMDALRLLETFPYSSSSRPDNAHAKVTKSGRFAGF